MLKKKKSAGKKNITKRSASKKKYVLKRNKVRKVEVSEEDVTINLEDMLLLINKKS